MPFYEELSHFLTKGMVGETLCTCNTTEIQEELQGGLRMMG